MLTLIKNRGQV